jgi:twitching motility two-component system response regulator PilH
MARILVVDDSGFQRKRTCRVLHRAGYETLDAPDGRAALEAVERDAPDLVITDLNMPTMTGMEFLAAVQERGLSLPIVVLTSDLQETTREECIERGAAEVLNKPVNDDRLLVTVEAFLGPAQAAAS